MFQICFLYKEIELGGREISNYKFRRQLGKFHYGKFSAFERRKDKPLGKETDF